MKATDVHLRDTVLEHDYIQILLEQGQGVGILQLHITTCYRTLEPCNACCHKHGTPSQSNLKDPLNIVTSSTITWQILIKIIGGIGDGQHMQASWKTNQTHFGCL